MASGTALVYDEEMTSYKLLWDHKDCEIEVPERLSTSYERLKYYNLVERCIEVPLREVTDEEVTLIHSPEYLEVIKSTQTMNEDELWNTANTYNAVFLHPNSYRCAKLAAGGTLQLVDSVISGKTRNGIALVRPPGHHSQRSEANGFCLFNNVAIAAEYVKKKYNLQRILIVDWDIHHGQGIQYAFEDDPSVLYFSWHRFQHQKFWPNLRDSDYDVVGKGRGTGFNINVPWNKVGMGNADYIAVFLHVLLPIAAEFNPELVLVSSGYDSAIGDPEGQMRATPECFSHLIHFLMQLAEGKCCVVLEGGYHLQSLSESISMTVKTLLGDPVPQLYGEMVPCLSAVESIQNVRDAHKPYWKCLAYNDAGPVQDVSTNGYVNDAYGTSSATNSEIASEVNVFLDSHMKKILFPVPPVKTAASIHEDKMTFLPKDLHIEKDTVEELEAFVSNLHAHLGREAEVVKSAGQMLNILNKILQKEVRNGIAESNSTPDFSVLALKQSIHFGLSRVFHIVIGDVDNIDWNGDGKIVSLRISDKQLPEFTGKRELYLNCNEDLQGNNSFLYPLLRLILPLAYSYQPELIVLTLGPSSKISTSGIASMSRFLQGLAEGRIFAVVQNTETKYLKAIAEALLEANTPAIAPYSPIPEYVQAIEEQRKALQTQWKMLQCSVG